MVGRIAAAADAAGAAAAAAAVVAVVAERTVAEGDIVAVAEGVLGGTVVEEEAGSVEEAGGAVEVAVAGTVVGVGAADSIAAGLVEHCKLQGTVAGAVGAACALGPCLPAPLPSFWHIAPHTACVPLTRR